MNKIVRPKQWICLGRKQLRKTLFNPIKNIPYFIKPMGGLWISPYQPQGEYKSDWERWCKEESGFRDYEEGVVLTLPNNIRVCTIDSQEDLMDFIKEVGLNNNHEDWFTIWKIPDYEKASEKYDLIYLTKKGERETRMPWINRAYTLYGWDASSGILLNYRIKSQRPIKF
jgi:hypothetical protein